MASIHKRDDSKFWIASFTGSDGRHLKRSTKTMVKSDAMKRAMEFEAASMGMMSVKQAKAVISDLMEAQGRALPAMTVRDWVARWTARRKDEVKPTTYLFYEASGRKWVEWLGARADGPLAGQGVQQLMEYRDALAARTSPYSTNHRMVCIGMILRAARLERLIDENPMDFIKPLKEMDDGPGRQPFTVPQLQAVLAVSDPEWKSMVLFGAYTGQRLSDVATLTWEKVNLTAGTIALKTRKTDRWMNLPLASALWEHLKAWDLDRPTRNEMHDPEYHRFVHPRCAGHVMRTGLSARLSNQFSDLLVYAGVRRIAHSRKASKSGRGAKRERNALSFHSLRHTATSWMKAAGIPASVVMDFIGHDDAAMSQLYTHTGDDALRKAADSLPVI